jgi:undecaprenyl diphosphate synthase
MGDLTMLPDSLKKVVARLDEHTQHNTGFKFCIALSYSGRHDIASACQRLAAKVEAGEMSSSDVTEAAISEELKTSWLGEAQDPDLLIRTSGEQRLSNFMLWQTAYTELHFVDSLWPDFGEVQFKEALLAYQKRNRRFGKRK